MSKKKVRKPKKKNYQKKKKADTGQDIIIVDSITNERINVSELIRNDDGINTSIKDLQYIYDVYERKDSPLHNEIKAQEIIVRLAKLGEPRACSVYGGQLLDDGHEKEALPYIRKGLKINDPNAFFASALYHYKHGRYQKSYDAFVQSSNLANDPTAAYNAYIIADEYLNDSKSAQAWFNKAAKLGSEDAKKNLWNYNLRDPIDHRDEKVALEALKNDFERCGQYDLYNLFYELAYTYIVTELSEHQFFSMLSKMSEDTLNVITAKAECYAFGIGTKPDAKKAKDYFSRLRFDRLAHMYVKYVDLNDPLGGFMEKAKSNKACAYFAGKMLYAGTYGERDVDLAIKCLEKSLSVTYPRTLSALAHIYLYDEKYCDVNKALEILEDYKLSLTSGCDLENLKDMYSLYHYGLGVDADEDKALEVLTHLGFYQPF